MTTTKETYIFKKGEHWHLDQIYAIQGLGNGDWWEHSGNDTQDSDPFGTDLGDDIVITRDIKITIAITKDQG